MEAAILKFMRTDTIFYQLFLTFHSLLFELLGEPMDIADNYTLNG